MAFGSVCLLRIRHPEYYRMNNYQKFQAIVEKELANAKGRFSTTRSLFDELHHRIKWSARSNLDVMSIGEVSFSAPRIVNGASVVNPEMVVKLNIPGQEALTATIAGEAFLNTLDLSWKFSEATGESVMSSITMLLKTYSGEEKSREVMAQHFANNVAIAHPEFNVQHALDKDGVWVVYFIHRKTAAAAIVGSWDLSEFFPDSTTDVKQFTETFAVDSILNMLTPPQELQGLGGIQRSPENLFIAVKTYLRNLRDYYRVAFPFTYQVLWATSTDSLAKPVLDLIGVEELSLIAESDAIINIIERNIGDDAELREKFLAHVRNPMHIATHIMVRITVDVGVTKTWFSPIAGMVRASGSYDVNTNNPHLPLWVVASFREVMTPPPRPRNPRDAVENYVTEAVDNLDRMFNKGSIFVPRLKANIASLWGSVIERHAKPELGFQAPYRVVLGLIADFALWLDNRGKKLMLADEYDFFFVVKQTAFAVEVIFTDCTTGRTETVLFTYADLEGQLKAGLDWHPSAPTFFIPREF